MKFTKKKLVDLTRCYCASALTLEGVSLPVLATEGEGACYLFGGKDYDTRRTVWPGPGGTMSFVALPGKDGEFLATQNFFPTFQAENSTIVWGRPREDGWEIRTVLRLPYVHRFDILSAEGVHYILCATLCTSKTEKEDWSDPGRLYAGVLPDDLSHPIGLTVIAEGLTKNHGYCKAAVDGRECGFIGSEEGVLQVFPPRTAGEGWEIRRITENPTSDIAAVDIDGDGELELAAIEPFHGSHFGIYKRREGFYERVYQYPKEAEFYHVVWGGLLRGRPAFIGGGRRGDKELFALTCRDAASLSFDLQIIDQGGGPSNIAVLPGKDRDVIVCANREIGEGALYFVTDEG